MSKPKARIVKRTKCDDRVLYVIQRRYFLFPWWWVDAWLYDPLSGARRTFSTLEEAQMKLCYFDGSKTKDEVVYPVPESEGS